MPKVGTPRLNDLAAIYASAPVGLAVLSTDLCFLHVNEQVAKMTGFPVAAHAGKTLRDLMPDFADSFESIARRIVETGEPVFDIEVEGESPGHPGVFGVWKEQWLSQKDASGKVVAINVVVADMTKEKRIERELRDKVEELQAVLDAVPAAVFVAQDPECRTMYGNRMTERILRQPSGANLSKSAREDGPRNFRTLKDGVEIDPRDLPVQKAAISGEAVRDFELTLAFDGDDVVRIYGNAEPLFDSSGKPRGAVGAFVDITQLDYQKALQRLTASLLESRETASRELSRELHDVFSQDLAALSMEVSALRHSDEVADPLKERLSALGKKIGRLTEEIHRTARQLHPAILDDLGLEVALREECLTFSERYDIPVQFTCEDLPPSLAARGESQ